MFSSEEELVFKEFSTTFQERIVLVVDIQKLIENLLQTSRVGANDYANYAAVILAGSSFKSLVSAYDRLSKGYLSDAETLIKKSIEGFFYQLHFHENKDDAKSWCIDNKKPEFRRGLRTLAYRLDVLNKENKFFPTDHEEFFTSIVHESGYGQSNRFAHLDFDTVHLEIGLENMDPAQFATTMVIGPKYEGEMMKITLNRLIMFSMFQATLLLYITDQQPSDLYQKVFDRFRQQFEQV